MLREVQCVLADVALDQFRVSGFECFDDMGVVDDRASEPTGVTDGAVPDGSYVHSEPGHLLREQLGLGLSRAPSVLATVSSNGDDMKGLTPDAPPGWSSWERELWLHLTGHIQAERGVLDEYLAVAESTSSKALSYLVRL